MEILLVKWFIEPVFCFQSCLNFGGWGFFAKEWSARYCVHYKECDGTKGVFFLAQAAAKEMISAGGGSIVAVSSMWGVAGASGEVAYSASKAAVIGLVKALAKELAPSGIRVNCVAPGVTDTEMNDCYDEGTMYELAEKTPLGRIADPSEIAEAIFFLASDKASFITGQTLTADGGFIS